MGKSKRKKRHNKPANKQAVVRPTLPPDTTQVVADIVNTLTHKKFGAKLSNKDPSRTNRKQAS